MIALRKLAAPFFIAAGVLHFIKPEPYESIVPSYLPAPKALVYASGVAEAAGGAGLLHPATRHAAGWLLAATMVGVFPANIEMAAHPERYPKLPGGKFALYARLPLQAVLIAWVLAAGKPDPAAASKIDEPA